MNTPHPRRLRGFTLVELMIAVAIVAILAAIAVPAYGRYVTAGKANTAKADMQTLALALEQTKLLQRQYPASAATTTADTQSLIAGGSWQPAQKDFDFGYTPASGSFTLSATGKNAMTGCTLTLVSNDATQNTASDACKTTW